MSEEVVEQEVTAQGAIEEVDFLADVEAADPESFNVCLSCD